MASTTVGNELPSYMITVNAGQELDCTVAVLDEERAPVPAVALGAARAQVRPSWRSETVLHTWTTTGATPNAELLDGAVRLTASAAETAAWQQAWPSLAAAWDLVVIDNAGASHRLTGISVIRINPLVTR